MDYRVCAMSGVSYPMFFHLCCSFHFLSRIVPFFRLYLPFFPSFFFLGYRGSMRDLFFELFIRPRRVRIYQYTHLPKQQVSATAQLVNPYKLTRNLILHADQIPS